jgi:hypothetical protein
MKILEIKEYMVIEHDRLIEVIDATTFMGLPRTYYLKEMAELSTARRTLMIGKVPVVASYLVREDNLAFWIGPEIQDKEQPIFWTGRKPDWVTTSEDLAELAASKLIEYLTKQSEEED